MIKQPIRKGMDRNEKETVDSSNYSTYGLSYDSMRGQFVGAKGGRNEHHSAVISF